MVWSLSGVTLTRKCYHYPLTSPEPIPLVEGSQPLWRPRRQPKTKQLHKKEVLPVLTWTGTGYPMKISFVKILLILNLVPDSLTIQVHSLKGLFLGQKRFLKILVIFHVLWKRVYVGKVRWKGLAALAKERERVISAISCRVIGNPRLKTRCNEHCTLENIAPLRIIHLGVTALISLALHSHTRVNFH